MKEVFGPVGRGNEAESLVRHFLDRAVRRRHRTSLIKVGRVAHRLFLRFACARFFTVRLDGAFAFVAFTALPLMAACRGLAGPSMTPSTSSIFMMRYGSPLSVISWPENVPKRI